MILKSSSAKAKSPNARSVLPLSSLSSGRLLLPKVNQAHLAKRPRTATVRVVAAAVHRAELVA